MDQTTTKLEEITDKEIVIHAWNLFGKPYQALQTRRMLRLLTREQYACMIDMECVAELDLMRQRGHRDECETEQQTGLL